MYRPIRFTILALALATVVLPSAAHAQFPYPPIYYPYPAYRYAGYEASVRIQVQPKEAAVYVDGYFAGKVEDFDGTFQRLHVEPGEHEITIYLDGYRSLHERLYLGPNTTRKIEGTLEKLAPGDPVEPVPQPAGRLERNEPGGRIPPPPPGRPGRRTTPPPPPDARGRQAPPPSGASRFGTISLRVQPSGATVLIDGERWMGPSGPDERLIVQLPEGRHRVEVERDGYERFVTEIDVRSNETAPLNVSLTRSR